MVPWTESEHVLLGSGFKHSHVVTGGTERELPAKDIAQMGDDALYWIHRVFDINWDDKVVHKMSGVVVVVDAIDVNPVSVEVVLKVSTGCIGLSNNVNSSPILCAASIWCWYIVVVVVLHIESDEAGEVLHLCEQGHLAGKLFHARLSSYTSCYPIDSVVPLSRDISITAKFPCPCLGGIHGV